MAKTREVQRDARDFDTTSLHAGFSGSAVHRDYSAHFFRWSFARRFIKLSDHVLEIGCGIERPLWRMLFHSTMPRAASYIGLDLNKLDTGVGRNHKHATLVGEFNFAADWKKLPQVVPLDHYPKAGMDVVVHLEVIEHMKVEHGRSMLKGCFASLRPGGVMLMSTPAYDGVRHAANHIHEYTIHELDAAVRKAGFVVEKRFGTFMDIRALKAAIRESGPDLGAPVKNIVRALEEYYDNDAISCIFAPLFPDYARNNLWVCRRPA